MGSMGSDQVCNTITKLFEKMRGPFQQISRILIICSMIKRPGLSAIQSTANIVASLNRLGIPTGAMPDGSDNLTVAFTYAVINEVFRALRLDALVQVGVVTPTNTGYGQIT